MRTRLSELAEREWAAGNLRAGETLRLYDIYIDALEKSPGRARHKT